MRLIITTLIVFFAYISFAQKWNPAYKKGGLYFFSTYYTDSTCSIPLNGTLEETIGNEKAVRQFHNGHLINEKKWLLKIQTHDYHIIKNKPFSAVYEVWDSLGHINERWKIFENSNGRRQLDITVFYSNGKKLVQYSYVQLTAQEYNEHFPDSLPTQKIDTKGYSPALVPVGKSLEWTENGTLIAQKEYAFDPRFIPEEKRRIGKFIRNYPNGLPWEIIEYPSKNPYRNLYPYKKYYENGNLMSELYFVSGGKAIKKEFTTNGQLSLIQWITDYNQIPNDNRTQWYSYDGLCYRMRDESPQADTVEFERNTATRFTYLLIKKDNITTINKNDPNGVPLEKTAIYPDSTRRTEIFKSGKLFKNIVQKNNIEMIQEMAPDDHLFIYQKKNGTIEGEFQSIHKGKEVQRFLYKDGISYDHPSTFTYEVDSINSIDSLYNNAYRRKSYYPFTLCLADTSNQIVAIKRAIGQFELDWKKYIPYHWSAKMEEMPLAEISWARGEQFTIIEILQTLSTPTYLIYYDHGYCEFLNREKEWSDISNSPFRYKLELLEQE